MFGYGIMYNEVLFSKKLKDKEKLLFCLLTSYCAEKGYSRATNECLGEKLNLHKDNISKYISSLEKLGYIKCKYEYEGKAIVSREIYINISFTPLGEITKPPLGEITKDNNIIYIYNIKDFKNIERDEDEKEEINLLTNEMNSILKYMFELGFIFKYKDFVSEYKEIRKRFYDISVAYCGGINPQSGSPNYGRLQQLLFGWYDFHKSKGTQIKNVKISIQTRLKNTLKFNKK